MPRRNPIVDRTYRLEPGPVNYWKEVARYIGGYVIVYLPHTGRWKQAWLCGLLPNRDEFVIRWKKRGHKHILKGIWRVHKRSLFALERGKGRLLPEPLYRDKLLPQSTNHKAKEGSTTVATKPKTGSSKTSSTKTAETNGASSTRTTNDKLAGLTEAKRRNIAKLITRERGKTPATAWPKVTEMVKEKYDWDLPGSMTGRRLMREYGPDGAEDAIIKQNRTSTGGSKRKSKKADPNVEALAGLSRAELKALIKEDEVEGVTVRKSMSDDDIRAAIIAAGWTAEVEDEEEVDEDEELDDDEEDDEEDDDEPSDEADDEDDEEDEPTPAPKPVAKKKPAAKRVAVKRKPKPKANPSK